MIPLQFLYNFYKILTIFFYFFQTNHCISFSVCRSYIFKIDFFFLLKKLLKLYRNCKHMISRLIIGLP